MTSLSSTNQNTINNMMDVLDECECEDILCRVHFLQCRFAESYVSQQLQQLNEQLQPTISDNAWKICMSIEELMCSLLEISR